MKIAINCAFYQPRSGGIAEYILNLVSNMALLDKTDEFILYVLEDMKEFAIRNFPQGFRIKTIPFKSSGIHRISRSLFEQGFWRKEEETERFDLFHSPFFHAPHFKRAKVLMTVHDLRFYRFPYTYSFPRYVYLRFAVKKSCLRADHIVTISQFTKDELMYAYGLSDDRITVVHEAINKERFSPLSGDSFVLPERYRFLKDCPYILSVGHLEPRKNYIRLIDAFDILKKKSGKPDLKLLIVGKKGHHYDNIIRKVNGNADVIYLDFVEHDFLRWLYGNASLFAFPSYYEGFGFPTLEAGCYGVVSAVSKISSMPEVCGDAVYYFDPYDVENMAEVMLTALTDPVGRSEKKERMAKQIDGFSWTKNASPTIDLYKRIYGETA